MSIEIPLQSTIRNIRRATEIVTVLVKFGFGDIVHASGLERLYMRGRRLFFRKTPPRSIQNLSFAARLRKAMEELGPTFIKFGQVLSTRPDLLPPDFIEEFVKFQDECTPLPFSVVKAELQKAFHGKQDEIFESIEETPLAAASIGQTHRAKLRDGTAVVVKIMRPNVRQMIRSDMEVMESLARIVETYYKNLGFSPVGLIREFAQEIEQEIDYNQEAQATERLRLLFKNVPDIKFAEIHWEACTAEVITEEEIHGTPLSKCNIDEWTVPQRKRFVRLGCDAVFRQCFEFGFFHADPHPGNLMVLPEGGIGFIDCGMTGNIDRHTSDYLASIFYGVIINDPDIVIHALTDLADVDSSISMRREFHSDVASFISKFQFMTIGRINLGRLLQEFFDRLRKYNIRCPSDIVFLIKTISTIEGVAAAIDPDFDLPAHARPYIERLVRRKYSPKSLRKRLGQTIVSYAEMIEHLPENAERMVRMFNRNRLQLRLTHEGLDTLDRTVSRASRRISAMLLSSSLVIGSSILILAQAISAEHLSLQGNLLLGAGIIAFTTGIGIGICSFFFGK